MRKLFSFVAAALLTLTANATILSIAPDSPQASDNIRREIRDHIQPGDTLMLADGVYTEIDVVELNKDVVIMAAEGAKPIVKQQYYMKLLNSAKVTIIGVKFDGSLYPATDHCIRAYDATEGKTLTVIDCEFTNFPNGFIFYPQRADRCMQTLTIKNCLFENFGRSAVYVETGSSTLPLAELNVENSTFMATTPGANRAIDLKNDGSEVADAKLRIDHCTFYNCNAVRSEKSTDVIVNNSIFAAPEGATYAATVFYAGAAINNCLTFNVSHTDGPTVTAPVVADPLFVNAAEGNLNLGEGSPALTAATDGGAIGDPRWVPAPAPVLENGFYLVGSFNSWTPAAEYHLVGNPNNNAEFMINVTLAENDELKVVNVLDGATTAWFPGGDNYVVDAAHAGEKTVYFRPDYQGGEDWFGACIYIAPNAEPQPVEMTTIYDWAGEIGTTVLGASGVEVSTVKIHENTDAIPGIKFGSSYVYADGKWLAIKPAEGGFLAGDVLSVAAVFNNADDTKYAQVDLRAANGDTRIWMSDSASTINGRTQAGEPIVQTYTLEADQDSLFLGRYGNTGMFVTLLKVERAAGDEPQPQECDWDAIDFLGDGSTEQTHSNQFKVCKVGEQPNVVNIQTPGFAAETGIYVTFPSAVFGEISLAEGQYVIEGAGMVLYLSAFTEEYTEVTVNWDGNDIVFTVYNAAAAPQPVEHTYTVAGGSAELFGTTWDPANTANDMVKQEDGTYKWEKTEVTLPAGNVEFKVVEDHAWTVCYPAENYQLVIPEAGVYTITITYNPEGNVVAGDAVKTGDAVVDPVVSIAGSMNSWNASADVMTIAEDKATASLTLNLEAQTYEFKVVINGGDWRSNAQEFTRENATAADMSGNLDNMHLVADVAGEYLFTWTFATNTLVITFPVGEGIDNTAVEVKAIKRIVNGQLFIEMNGVLYNAQGTIVR